MEQHVGWASWGVMVQCGGGGYQLSRTFSQHTSPSQPPGLLLPFCFITPVSALLLLHWPLTLLLAIRRVGRFPHLLNSICFTACFREADVHQAAGEPGGVGRRHSGILLRGAWRPNSNCPLEERGGGAAAGQVLLKKHNNKALFELHCCAARLWIAPSTRTLSPVCLRCREKPAKHGLATF